MSQERPYQPSSDGWPLDNGHADEFPNTTTMLTEPPDQPDWSADDWIPQNKRGIRLATPLASLCAVVLLAGGFWAGAALQKTRNSATTSTLATFATRRAAAQTGASGASGPRGFAGLGTSSTAATTGTVSVIDGDTLYVKTSSGSLVKVTFTKQTTITRDADAAADDLRPGDTITITGSTATSGTVNASKITATAPGLTTGFADFPTETGTPDTGATGSTTTTTPSLFGG